MGNCDTPFLPRGCHRSTRVVSLSGTKQRPTQEVRIGKANDGPIEDRIAGSKLRPLAQCCWCANARCTSQPTESNSQGNCNLIASIDSIRQARGSLGAPNREFPIARQELLDADAKLKSKESAASGIRHHHKSHAENVSNQFSITRRW
jgi:hypothetical protein